MSFPIGRFVETWTIDPAGLVAVAAAGLAYERGRRRIRRMAGPGRVVTTGGVWCFVAGMACVLLALDSPLGALDDVLFSAHMAQHMLLGLVAPLLIVLGRPGTVMAWGLRPAQRRELEARWRATPLRHVNRRGAWTMVVAVCAHVGSWWLWHLPPMFDLALRSDLVHAVEHATLFATGLALWWVVTGVRWKERTALAILALFAAETGTGMLAALIVLSDRPIYTVSPELHSWGIHALADQQLGGVEMWVLGGFIYLGAVTALTLRWLERGPASGAGRQPSASRPVPPPPPLPHHASSRGTIATSSRR